MFVLTDCHCKYFYYFQCYLRNIGNEIKNSVDIELCKYIQVYLSIIFSIMFY